MTKNIRLIYLLCLLLGISLTTHAQYIERTPAGLPQSSTTGMAFLNLDGDEQLEFVYSYINNNGKATTEIYQTQDSVIRTDLVFEEEDLFITNLQSVSFVPNRTQLLAVEPFQEGDDDDEELFKFSLFEFVGKEGNEDDEIEGLVEIPTSFSSISFKKITYEVFDFDGDGDMDIFFIGEGKPTVIEVLINEGDYIFSNLPLQLDEYKQATLAHYDFTKDGLEDVYLSGIVDGDTIGDLFENVDGQYLKPLITKGGKTLDIPAIVDGEVIIQHFDNNETPDVYIRGLENGEVISAIYELQEEDFVETTSLPYFTNGLAEIHDFNNDGYYDILLSGYFLDNQLHTEIHYQDENGDLFSIENLYALHFSNATVGDINQDGNLELVMSGFFYDETLDDIVPRTFFYTSNYPENTPPFFENPATDVRYRVNENEVTILWNKADDDETEEDILFYELYLWDEDMNRLLPSSSLPGGERIYPNKGIIQDTFLVLKDLPRGIYNISIQAIDNGLMASEATDPIEVRVEAELPEEFFETYEIVQFRGERFENKFDIVDLDADSYKDFLLIDSSDALSFLSQRNINVFQKSNFFSEVVEENTHFELGDFTLDGYVDVWYLEGEGANSKLFIADVQNEEIIETDIKGLENFVLCDIDNDLDLDIIADSPTQSGTVFYENNNEEFELTLFSFDEFLRPVGVYDFNKDSYLDFYYITDTLDGRKNIYLAVNNYNGNLGKNSNRLFNVKKIVDNKDFEIVDGFDAGTDGDWDLLIQNEAGYAILENRGFGDWGETALPFNAKISDDQQIRLADFDGDFKKEVWRFSIDSLVIFSPKNDITYSYATGINKPDENWGNDSDTIEALQWIKIVDLDADGRNDLLAHVIISNRAQTYYFPNVFENTTKFIPTPSKLNTESIIGRSTLHWNWENTTDAEPQYLLEVRQVIYRGQDTITQLLNFDAVHDIEDEEDFVSSQLSEVNYLGNVDSLQINELVEGDYIWRIIAKIDNQFSTWSDWDTLEIRNFVPQKIPPVFDFNQREVEGNSRFSKAGDFDNDGDLDFILTSIKNDQAQNFIYVNQGEEKFDTVRIDLPAFAYADIELIDYNKDGFLDLMVSGIDPTWTTPISAIYQNTQELNFVKVVDLPAVAFGSMTHADMNNDGDIDYIITGKNSEGAYENYFIEDTSLASIKTPALRYTSFTIDNNTSNKLIAKFLDNNDDGLTDVLFSVYNPTESYIIIMENDELSADMKIKNKGSKENTSSHEFTYFDFGDYDSDGSLDLITVGITINSTSSTTTGAFDHEKAYYTDKSLIADENLNWILTVYQGDGEKTPNQQNILPSINLGQNRIENIQWWDIDNDGDLDFFVSEAGKIIFIEKNDNGNFERSNQFHIDDDFAYSTFGDFTNDTRLDFVIGSLTDDYFIYKNNVSNANANPEAPTIKEVTHPTIEGQEEIIDGTSVTVSWEEASDDLFFGTDAEALRYRVTVFKDDELFIDGESQLKSHSYTTNNTSFTLTGLEDGVYTYRVQTVDQSFGISPANTPLDTFVIDMEPRILADSNICQNTLIGFPIFPIEQEYKWTIISSTGSDTLISEYDEDSIQVSFDTSSVVVQKIIVENRNFKSKRDTLVVKVFPQPKADFIIGEDVSVGALVPFINTSSTYATSFSWDIEEEEEIYTEENPVHVFEEGGKHDIRLTIKNDIGCIATRDSSIIVNNDVVVNTSAFITQNGDEKNDFLYIEHLDRYPTNQVRIFNQWGQEIKLIENYANDWEIQFGDEKLAVGNYFLIIDVNVGEGTQTFKSTFSVLK
ncbi:MAG: T9SS type B sorting domain-containing protein [Cytophagales bacterium]|nr:T9SS type B sorting domain-containing protein [Cytophagales bacterium]